MNIKVCMTKPFSPPESDDCTLVVFKNGETIVTPEYESLFLSSCQKYAQKYQVYLVSCLYESNGYLCMAMFDPQGNTLGVQQATHLNLEYLRRLRPSDQVEILATPIGNIFMSVDVDIYRPDVLRLAMFKGCDYIVSSQMFPLVDFSEERILFGARSASVANRMPVLQVTPFSSALMVPPEISPDGRGFLGYPTGKPVTVQFDWETAAFSRKVLIDSLLSSSCFGRYRNILEK